MPEPSLVITAGTLLEEHVRERVVAAVAAVPVDFGGGSSASKALVAADLIASAGIEHVVEVGVWRGRWLLPVAAALAGLGRGTITGIDPYDAGEALQTDARPLLDDLRVWAEETDWDTVHAEVLARIDELGVAGHCTLVREPSATGVARFADGSLGMVHIDGNHDHGVVARDLADWTPKVQPGGYLVVDDMSWPAVRRAAEWLRDEWELVIELVDVSARLSAGEYNDFAVFRRPAS